MKIKKRSKIHLSTERLLIIGMIVSDQFLKRILPHFQTKLLEGKYAGIVGRWCVDYFKRYKKAPQRTIEEIYKNKVQKIDFDEDTKDLIESFLLSINDEYELQDKFNLEYALDSSIQYLKRRELQRLSEDIKALTEQDKQDKADELIAKYKEKKNEFNNLHSYYDPIRDREVHERAFQNKEIPSLFTYPGEFGKMINRYLTRNTLIAFLSQPKAGKSFWKLELSIRALRQRNNVAVFQAGDMDQEEWDQRLMSHITRKPIVRPYNNILMPIMDCKWNQDNSCRKKIRTCRVGVIIDPDESLETIPFDQAEDYRACTKCEFKKPEDYEPAVWFQKLDTTPYDLGEADKALDELHKQAKGKRMLISTHPYNTLKPSMIENILDEWQETEQFIPDVILIDYAGILESDSGKDERERENSKWKDLRMLSQTRHCLVVSSHQMNAQGDVSLDRRIQAHAVAIFDLKQTEKEKDKGLINIEVRVGRHAKYSKVTVLQCLDISRAFLGSY